ncbi:MAG TPA: helix-turn-helix domain-containing protein [Saprospiraceae bacterium]|nr:helix-turn-helix domain-containing protein [Saprospiraceae bacterium]
MKYKEAKEEFVQIWGTLGTNWGINKAMAQIHALLLATENPLSTDEIMDQLQISRSNANLNIRNLMDWGLVYKKHMAGDRKEYFVADKDMWSVTIKIMRQRRRREIEPVVQELKQVSKFEATTYEEKNFKKMLEEMNDLSGKLLSIGDLLERADKMKFFKWIIKGF